MGKSAETSALPGAERNRRIRALEAITITHPRLLLFEELLDRLIEDTEILIQTNDKRRTAAKERRIKPALAHLGYIPVIAPTGATKSTTLMRAMDRINERAPAGQTPVAYISIPETVRTSKALYSEIFRVFEDDNNRANLDASLSLPNAHEIEEAIIEAVRPIGTRVVIVDEVHNLLAHDAGKVGQAMAIALKSILNSSVFALVLAGTEDASRLFALHPELGGRLYENFELGKLRIDSGEDRAYFFKFVKKYEARLVKDGVLDAEYDLTSDVRSRAQIYQAAEGVVGVVVRIMKIAVRRAFARGRTMLEHDDLADATFGYWATIDSKRKNPFTAGPDDEILSRIKAARTPEPA